MSKNSTALNIEPELKSRAAALFEELGLDLSTATRMFYKQALRCNGLPFDTTLDVPNAETLAAIEEVRQMRKNPSAGKAYTDVDEMMKELLA